MRMKYVVDKFSMEMFPEPNLLFIRHELAEEEFYALIEDAYSCVWAEDIAKILGVACNKDYVKARVGDIILVAQMSHGVLKYYCVQVCKNHHPLLRTEEAEELI